MARAKGGRSRMDLRREAEAVEARDKDKTKDEDEELDEDEEEDEDDEEEGEDDEADAEADTDDDVGDDDDDEDAPKKKKKKPKKEVVKKPAAKRTRTPKEVRMKAIWVVFDNASKRVGVFPFKDKKQAEKLLEAKIEEKKTTFYLQLIKEPLEEEVKETTEKKKK